MVQRLAAFALHATMASPHPPVDYVLLALLEHSPSLEATVKSVLLVLVVALDHPSVLHVRLDSHPYLEVNAYPDVLSVEFGLISSNNALFVLSILLPVLVMLDVPNVLEMVSHQSPAVLATALVELLVR